MHALCTLFTPLESAIFRTINQAERSLNVQKNAANLSVHGVDFIGF